MGERKIVIEFTLETAKEIVRDVLTLRGATSCAPGQTPKLDALVNTLVLEYAKETGAVLLVSPLLTAWVRQQLKESNT
jgi:hypothetical protein